MNKVEVDKGARPTQSLESSDGPGPRLRWALSTFLLPQPAYPLTVFFTLKLSEYKRKERGQQEAYTFIALRPTETPISISLNSLSDTLNHCPEPPTLSSAGLAGKHIASRCLELLSGDLRLQESAAGWRRSFGVRQGSRMHTIRGVWLPLRALQPRHWSYCHTDFLCPVCKKHDGCPDLTSLGLSILSPWFSEPTL